MSTRVIGVSLLRRAPAEGDELAFERLVGRAVRGRAREHDHRSDVRCDEPVCAYDFAKSALDQVALDGGVRMPRNDDSNARILCRSDRANLQRRSAKRLASRADPRKIGTARQSTGTRKALTATLRRTSTAASLSGAFAPSCGAGSVPPAPTSWTCASGNHACGFFSCFAGCKSAFPSLLLAVQKTVRPKPLNLFTSSRYFKSRGICLHPRVLTYPHRKSYIRSPFFPEFRDTFCRRSLDHPARSSSP